MRKLAHLYHPIVCRKCKSLRIWFVILHYVCSSAKRLRRRHLFRRI